MAVPDVGECVCGSSEPRCVACLCLDVVDRSDLDRAYTYVPLHALLPVDTLRMTTTLAVVLCVAALVAHAAAGDPPASGVGGKAMTSGQCQFQTADGLSYDLSALKKTSGEDYTKIIQVGPNIQFIYRMNLCANTLVNCQNEPAPATEALKIPAGETCRVLGRLSGATWKTIESPKSDKNPWGKSLEITYVNGDMCDPAKATSRSVTLRLECDLTAKDPTKFFNEVKKEATCNTQYVFTSASVCPSTGGSHSRKLLGMLFFGFALYCVVGVGYNKFALNKPWGSDVIPNAQFWNDFPSLVQDGISFTMQKVQDVQQNGLGALMGGSGGGSFGGGDSSASGSKRGARYGPAATTGGKGPGV